ncbi:MAG: GGDEF domain-containing protein [Burkholderiaceae bacterium]|nr:GGDEF domain-containing protein [Burkholderiaceae bacterium]
MPASGHRVGRGRLRLWWRRSLGRSAGRGRALHLGLASWMALIAALAMAPLVAFSTYGVWTLIEAKQVEGRERMQRRAHTAAQAVGRELQQAIATLEALALSDPALNRDTAGLAAYASRVAGANAAVHALSMLDREGRTVFRSDAAAGPAAPAASGLRGDRRPLSTDEAMVFSYGATAVSELRYAGAERQPVVEVSVPVWGSNGVEHMLSLSLKASVIAQVLDAQLWPPGWVTAVVDQNQVLLARNVDPTQHVGRPASVGLQQAMASRQAGVFESRTRSGQNVLATLQRVPESAWYVAVGVPSDELRLEWRNAVGGMLAGGATLALLGMAGAFVVSRRIAEQARAAAAGHDAAGAPARPGWSRVREFSAMAQAQAQTRAKAAIQRGGSELDRARRDDLTGLPRRELFRQQAEAALEHAAQDDSRALAMLYLDLDGFKSANDQHGHAEGDRILRGVAQALTATIRPDDMAGRLGGDEFAVLLCAPAGQVDSVAAEVGKRLLLAIGQVREGVGCTVGICVGDGSSSVDALLAAADQAMLDGKKRCKNRLYFAHKAN